MEVDRGSLLLEKPDFGRETKRLGNRPFWEHNTYRTANRRVRCGQAGVEGVDGFEGDGAGGLGILRFALQPAGNETHRLDVTN